MSTNCIHTKLIGNIQNDSLPILNCIYLDTPATTGSNKNLTFQTGSKGVVLESEIGIYTSSSLSDEPRTRIEISANNLVSVYFNSAEMAYPIERCISIKGPGIYELKRLGSSFIDLLANENCISNQKSNPSLAVFGGNNTSGNGMESVMTTSMQFLQCKSMIDEKFLLPPYNLVVLQVEEIQTPLSNNTKKNTTIERLRSITGSISNLPRNIKVFLVGNATGSVENLVAAMLDNSRPGGAKTSGSIKFGDIRTNTQITYNGQALYTALGLTSSGNKTLNWDAQGNITWDDSTPENMPNGNYNNYEIR